MNRFNLSFKGEIQPGKDPAQVKARFGKLFGIDDPQRLERFFSGETITLRRNLERKTAAEYFSKLRKLGVEAELVKVTAQEAAAAIAPVPASPPSPPKPAPEDEEKEQAASPVTKPGMDREILQRRPGQVDQSWAVSSSRAQARSVQRKAEKEKAEREAAEEAARRRAEEEEARRRAEAEAARRKAEKEEAERKAAEEAARRRAEEEEARRRAEAEAARRKAEREEARRKAREEAARRAAEKAEQAARRKAAREEARRKAAEEAARKQALREEQKRKAAEEAARKKAQREEEKRRAAEEAARRKAQEAEARRKAAEEAARQRAIKEEAKRKAQEEEARRRAEEKARKAEEAARRAAEKAELQRMKAEAAAAKKAAEAEAKRKAAEEAARHREQLAEQKREQAERETREKALQEQLRREQEQAAAREREERQRQEAEKQRKLKAEREARARREKAAQEQARREAAAAAAAEKARQDAARREQQAQRKAMEEQAIQRAAQELSRQPSLKPVAAKVRTKLDLPQKQATKRPVSHQAGAPNLYTLKPFRNGAEVKSRVEQSRQRMRRHLGLAAAAVACLLVLTGAFLELAPPAPVSGPSGLAIDPGRGPVLLAGDRLLLHDRAGVGSGEIPLSELGVTELSATMVFGPENELLALGELAGDPIAATSLLRCALETTSCSALPGQLRAVKAFAQNSLDGSLFLADTTEGKLLHVDKAGEPLASASLKLPEQPVLRLESGLLFINSAEAPAISVFRYDQRAFGSQLDEVLLLPAPALEAEQTRVSDFLFNAGAWWVTMENPDTASRAVYRFDSNWDYLGQVALERGTTPDRLVAWGRKTLILDRGKVPVQRFNAEGLAEVPLESDLLQSLVEGQQRWRFVTDTLWHSAFIVVGLVALGALLMAWLQGTRALVYKARQARGAQPIDDLADEISWIDPLPDRAARFRRINITWGIISLAAVLVAVGAGISVIELGALLLALAGFSWGLLLLQRSATGHIGIVQGQVLLVDHDDMYHLGQDARLQYRGPFLSIDDVVVFRGNALVPAFRQEQYEQQVTPLALGGVRVDRKTVLVKLLQGKHPLTQSAGIALAGFMLAAILLAMHWL